MRILRSIVKPMDNFLPIGAPDLTIAAE